MAIRLLEGFDWSNLVGGGSGSATDLYSRYNVIDTAGVIVSPGRFGGQCFLLAGGAPLFFDMTGGPFGPRLVAGFAWFSEGPAANEVFNIFEFWDGVPNHGGTCQCGLTTDSLARVEARSSFNGGVFAGATGTLRMLANTWYYIEVNVLFGTAGTGSFACQIEGVSQFNIGGITTQLSASAQARGMRFTGIGNTSRIDDYYVKDTTGFLNPSKVVTLFPTADGSNSQWTPDSGGVHFNRVNQNPEDGDTTFVSDATAGDKDSYAFADLTVNPQSIFAVQVGLFARKDDAAARSIATLVRSGGVNFTGNTQVITSTYLGFYVQIYEQDPNTAAAWTFSGVNNAEFGVQTIS